MDESMCKRIAETLRGMGFFNVTEEIGSVFYTDASGERYEVNERPIGVDTSIPVTDTTNREKGKGVGNCRMLYAVSYRERWDDGDGGLETGTVGTVFTDRATAIAFTGKLAEEAKERMADEIGAEDVEETDERDGRTVRSESCGTYAAYWVTSVGLNDGGEE